MRSVQLSAFSAQPIQKAESRPPSADSFSSLITYKDMVDEAPFIFSDLNLSRRLERAEARSYVGFVEARALVSPEVGACWTEVAGCYAMFDGVESPVTQTFCL